MVPDDFLLAIGSRVESSMRMSPRERRLAADYRSISQLLSESTILQADAKGNPPQHYRFRFHGWGVGLDTRGDIVAFETHEVVVELGAAYPRLMPSLIWQSPIFHPNISSNGIVCLGGYGTHWVPSLTLSELCTMLWDIIRYKNFNNDSPYNREAANWARTQTQFGFPLDLRPLRNRVNGQIRHVSSPNRSDSVDDTVVQQRPPAEIIFLD
jgi:ubiquitin-protein ligase